MELLLRLSLLTNAFDKLIMQEVAKVEPAVPRAGLVFEAIVGPWIEQLGSDLFRLTPLLSDSGREGLAEGLQRGIRRQVLEHLIQRRPFPGEQFLQVLLLAYPLEHRVGLTWFAGALLNTSQRDKETFKRLAQEVSSFTAFGQSEKRLLFAPDAHLSSLLRFAQLQVAVANGRYRRAAEIFDQLLWEIDQLPANRRGRLRAIAFSTALVERKIPLSPGRWIGMLHDLAAIPEVGKELTRRLEFPGPIADLISPTYEEMLFVWRASALDGIDALASLIETLNAETPINRERYLTATRNSAQSRELIVSSAWLAEVRKPGFDSRAAVARLADLYRIAFAWSNNDIAVEIGCAQAVLLDEYAHDREAALAVLAAAQANFPSDYRINRQRQRVYYRAGDHARALQEFESFASALERATPVERAWTLREAGRSAALTGDRNKALSFFESAWEASRKGSSQMAVMTAGLSADCAILEFEAGDIEQAIALMLRAITEADAVDFSAGLREHYCALILLAAILWMRGSAEDWPADRQAMVIGMCSEPNPRPEFKERRLPQRLLLWYQLAELEADRTDSEAALAALRERTNASGLLPMEATLSVSLVRSAVRTLNVNRFLESLPVEPRAARVANEVMARSSPESVYEMPTGGLSPLSPDEWSDPFFAQVAKTTVLVFAIVAVCSGRPEVLAQLRTRLPEIGGLPPQLTTLFEVIDEPAIGAESLLAEVASTVGHMLQRDYVFDAAGAFAATVHFFQLLRRHELGEVAAVTVFTHFSVVWRDILANRRFSVRAPAVSEPSILESLSRAGPYRARLAHLILASEIAVTRHLSDELRATIRAAAT
jgi:tetratricopeptide (TPR) repeat protein